MQEQTITLTEYWEQMKAKMRGFLDSHPGLPKEHPAKKAAEAVIGMANAGGTLEEIAGRRFGPLVNLGRHGPGIKATITKLSENIGRQNDKTKNYIPIKSDDPTDKDFAKVYLSGLKEFLKVKSP